MRTNFLVLNGGVILWIPAPATLTLVSGWSDRLPRWAVPAAHPTEVPCVPGTQGTSVISGLAGATAQARGRVVANVSLVAVLVVAAQPAHGLIALGPAAGHAVEDRVVAHQELRPAREA